MERYRNLNELFFVSNTKPLKEIEIHYNINEFHMILCDVCGFCNNEYLDTNRLLALYEKYVDIFNSHKGNLRDYFLSIISTKRFELKAYMIFGEDLWKKTKGDVSIDFYINRGYRYDYAVKLLKDRQSLTSEESFKRRYGDDWKKHFDCYINKHKESLNSNPNIEEINYKKGNSMRYEFYLDKTNPDTNELYTEIEAKNLILNKSKHASKKCAEMRREKTGVTGRSLQYWINKGFDERIARQRVNEIQSTNTVEKYIKKYGEQDGIKKWMMRNKVWGEKMQEKKMESGHIGCAYSQSSKIFFDKLIEKFKENNLVFNKVYYGETEYCKWDGEYKRPYFYDFVIPEINLCIEYNGLKFHPREGDKSWVGLFGDSYEYKLNYDKQKIKVIEDYGFEVIVVWEDEDIDNKIEEIVLRVKK